VPIANYKDLNSRKMRNSKSTLDSTKTNIYKMCPKKYREIKENLYQGGKRFQDLIERCYLGLHNLLDIFIFCLRSKYEVSLRIGVLKQ
jgi:hypothetical protein